MILQLYKPTERYHKFICLLTHRVKNLDVMAENTDKVYDPHPGKGFTRKFKKTSWIPRHNKISFIAELSRAAEHHG